MKSVIPTCFLLLVVQHRGLTVQRPEANLGMNLERPLLALWRHCGAHLLDFRPYMERLLAQPSSRLLAIDGAPPDIMNSDRLGPLSVGDGRSGRTGRKNSYNLTLLKIIKI